MSNFKAIYLSTILFGSNLFADIGTDFQNVVSEMRNNRKSSPILYKALITTSVVALIVPALGVLVYAGRPQTFEKESFALCAGLLAFSGILFSSSQFQYRSWTNKIVKSFEEECTQTIKLLQNATEEECNIIVNVRLKNDSTLVSMTNSQEEKTRESFDNVLKAATARLKVLKKEQSI